MKRVIGAVAAALILAAGSYFLIFYSGNEPDEELRTRYEAKETEEVEVSSYIPHKYGVPEDYSAELNLKKLIKADVKKTIKVLDEKENEVDVNVELDDEEKTLQINAHDTYEKGKTYTVISSEPLVLADGTEFDRGEQLRFTIDRDEIEEVVLNPEVIKVEKDELESLNEKTLKIKKQADLIKASDILIVYPEEAEDGLAVKVSKVETKGRSHVIEYEKPYFEELFDELELYKDRVVNKEQVIPTKGVQVSSDTQSVGVQVASAKNFFETDKKPEVNSSALVFEVDKEIELENGLARLTGKINLVDPRIIAFLTQTATTESAIVFKSQHHADLKIQSDLSKQKKSNKQAEKTKLELGVIELPLESPYLKIKGHVYLELQIDGQGEIDSEITFDMKNERALIYQEEQEKLEFIQEIDSETKSEWTGEGQEDFQINMGHSAFLTAFGLISTGIDSSAGVEGEAQARAGSDKRIGDYACYQYEQTSHAHDRLLLGNLTLDKEYLLTNIKKPQTMSKDTCQQLTEFIIEPEEINLASNEEVKVDAKFEYMDLLTLKAYEKTLGELKESIKYELADEGVVDIHIKDDQFIVKAKERPTKEKTKLIIKGDEDLTLPIVINNYAEVEEQIKKEQELSDDKIKEIVTEIHSGFNQTVNDRGFERIFEDYPGDLPASERDLWINRIDPSTGYYQYLHEKMYPKISEFVTKGDGMKFFIDEAYGLYFNPAGISIFLPYGEFEIVSKEEDKFIVHQIFEQGSIYKYVLEFIKEDGKWKLASGKDVSEWQRGD